jgi:hypothetical protein
MTKVGLKSEPENHATTDAATPPVTRSEDRTEETTTSGNTATALAVQQRVPRQRGQTDRALSVPLPALGPLLATPSINWLRSFWRRALLPSLCRGVSRSQAPHGLGNGSAAQNDSPHR